MKATLILSLLILAVSSTLFWLFTLYGPAWTERVVARNPQAQIELARQFLEDGHVDDAVARFRRAATLAPENPKYWYELGTALIVQGEYEEAIEHIERAREILPAYLEDLPAEDYDRNWILSLYFQSISLAYERLGKIDEAIQNGERATDILIDHKNRAAVMGQLIRLLARHDRYTALEDRTREAISLAPGDAEWHYLLALSLHQTGGDGEEALKAVDQAILLDGSPRQFRLKSDILLQAGRPEAALVSLEEGLQRDVDDPELLAAAIRVARQLDRMDKAEVWLQQLTGLAKDDPRARKYLDALQDDAGSTGAAFGTSSATSLPTQPSAAVSTEPVSPGSPAVESATSTGAAVAANPGP